MTADNPRQQQLLRDLDPLVREKLAELRRAIDLRRNEGFQSALAEVMTGRGAAAMDQIRQALADAQAEEERLLAERIAAKNAGNRNTVRALVTGSLPGLRAFGLGVPVPPLGNRPARGNRAALRQHQDHLENTVAARTQTLAETDAQLRLLSNAVESAANGIAITDPQGRIWINPAFTRLTGHTAAEAIGQNPRS